MPADARDAVTLAVAGREHRDWESYSIDSDLFTPADAWQVSLGIPAGEVPASLHPWAEVELRLGTDTVLTGRIDALRRRLARGAHSLTLHGRDLAAVLLDCSAPVLARRELSLAEVCATWLRPLGIDRMDIQGGDTSRKVTVEPGMSAWEVLERAAEASGLWPWFAPDGVLHVAAPDYGRATDAELILRDNGRDGGGAKNNILDLTFEDDIRRRHNIVTSAGIPGFMTPSASFIETLIQKTMFARSLCVSDIRGLYSACWLISVTVASKARFGNGSTKTLHFAPSLTSASCVEGI